MGVEVRMPFKQSDAVKKLEQMREMVFLDCMRHEDVCFNEDCPFHVLRMELWAMLESLVVAHGGAPTPDDEGSGREGEFPHQCPGGLRH